MRIFVAGPYGDRLSKEQIQANVDKADEIGRALLKLGHTPYIPHKMTHHWEDDPELTREMYLRLDREWLRLCDAIYFFGHSEGADAELALAEHLGLLVFVSMEVVELYTI